LDLSEQFIVTTLEKAYRVGQVCVPDTKDGVRGAFRDGANGETMSRDDLADLDSVVLALDLQGQQTAYRQCNCG
jgi:hypothetical protein